MTSKDLILWAALGCLGSAAAQTTRLPNLPYAQAGLSERQAAEVLLDRVAYGARPGEVDRVLKQGLSPWLARQLAAAEPEDRLQAQLAAEPARYRAMSLSPAQLMATYPSGGMIAAEARRTQDLIPPPDTPVDAAWRSRKLAQFKKEQGYLDPERELYQQLVDQKLTRALLAENQLRERLVDFWQNHFFAGSHHFRSRPWVLSHEVEALRPRVLGPFRALLGAAVKHPAIVQLHRDGAGAPGSPALLMQQALLRLPEAERPARAAAVQAEIQAMEAEDDLLLQRRFWPASGPNPAFAQALLGVYTLGPAGGWSAQDLQDTARVLTGWSSVPVGPSAAWFKTGFTQALPLGFVQQGGFLFRADQHDAEPKQVLGLALPAHGGLDEGERLLDHLARHPATAQHLARKLVQRFVDAEAPPAALVQHLALRFQRSNGDLTQVMQALFESPAFWQRAAQRQQAKRPFDYVLSALRSRDAQVGDVSGLSAWLGRMGEPPYAYLDVAGRPVTAATWLQPAALRTRWAFAERLSLDEIEGVRLPPQADPAALALLWASPAFQMH